jgi:UDP:flavonoid glycosyltransferase YjiC (YdhE family)
MKSKKILYGVCGIGMGHTYRQLPLLDELAIDNRIVLFVYGESKSCSTKSISATARTSRC